MKLDSRYLLYLIILGLILISMSSCAPSDLTIEKYGFLDGIGHGLTSLFSIIADYFGKDYGIYAQYNSGIMYWFGFAIGIIIQIFLCMIINPIVAIINIIVHCLAFFL